MGKVRVYELAKELNTTSKRLMEKLAEININLKNHMSLLEDDQLEALYKHIGVKIKTDGSAGEQAQESEPAGGAQKTEPRRETKDIPRIIRKTEIIINTKKDDYDSYYDGRTGHAGDAGAYSHKKDTRYGQKDSGFRVSTERSGLRPGFVRDSRADIGKVSRPVAKPEAKQEFRTDTKTNAAIPLKKTEMPKQDSRPDTKDAEAGGTPVVGREKQEELQYTENHAENVAQSTPEMHRDDKPSVPQGSKLPMTQEARPPVPRDDKPLTQQEARPSMPQGSKPPMAHEARPSMSQGGRPPMRREDGPYAGGRERGTQQRSGSAQGYQAGRGPDQDRHQRSAPQSSGVQGSRPYDRGPRRDFKPGMGTRPGEGRTGPRVDFLQPSETPPVRRDHKTDRIKEQMKVEKREVKRDILKGIPDEKDTKYNKLSITAEHKRVSEVLSEDFVLQEFYDDTEMRKRRKAVKPRKEEETKHIPPRAVLTEVSIPEAVTVKELAEILKKTSGEVMKKLITYGIMATINQIIDFDTASMVAEEYGIKAEKMVVVSEEDILFDDSDDRPEDLMPRPPIVVVMGHVDHGKTSLLDAIRKTNVTEQETGGITQHIGAYMAKINNRYITFLDTPGHEAFTAMRARGAKVTDIAVLVVAADDGVMPQTIEAINHAKAANVSIIVAINKIDKPGANPDKIKQDLTEYGLVSEEWGGDTIFVPVSAKQMQNIDTLLEMILLVADVLELKANPNRQAKGTVIEAKLDKARGPIATVLVQRGTLKVGDSIVTGTTLGRIRAMTDDKGIKVDSAGPSTPVEILGLPEVPEAGEIFYAVTDEKVARHLAEKRKLRHREEQLKSDARVSLDALFNQIKEGKVKDLNIIVKADVQGSVEALKQSLEKLSNDEVRVRIVHGGVGAVTESDVKLAEVSNAIIIGFNVRPAVNVMGIAENAGVDIRFYRIIYEAIDDIEAAMKGLLEPKFKEVTLGHAEVRQTFKVPSVGIVGGCHVIDGRISRNSNVRVVRNGIVVHEGKLASLKRFKDDVKEVVEGFECGMGIEKFNDIKEGDVIESFEMQEIAR